jgi:RNA polymerase sigma factor (TIGR02999 family)
MSDVSVTQILRRLDSGEPHAARELFPLVYDALRKQAGYWLSHERKDHTLQATALVNEVFVKMADGQDVKWESRLHFYNAASSAMRKILVDHARAKKADKRGKDWRRIDLTGVDVAEIRPDLDFEGLDAALTKLQTLDERRYQVVMYRYFSGLDERQVAELMGVAVKTVQRDWKTAKMFLLAEINEQSGRTTTQ